MVAVISAKEICECLSEFHPSKRGKFGHRQTKQLWIGNCGHVADAAAIQVVDEAELLPEAVTKEKDCILSRQGFLNQIRQSRCRHPGA